MSIDRRRTPRVQLLGQLHGHLVTLDVPITVTELSLGGMRFETSIAFPADAVHDFGLTLGDESTVMLRGRVMHCRSIGTDDAKPLYAVGVQFIEADEAGAIEPLIHRIS